MTRVRQAGERIEELLGVLRSSSGDAGAAAEGEAGDQVRDRLLADPLVENLLLLHDLHPLDVDTRIQRALDRVRPYLGSHAGGVEYLGTGPDGVARLRLEGSCDGCPSSTVTVQLAIQGAIEDAAPEVTDVVVEGMTEPPGPPLLQIGRRPDDAASGPPSSPAGDTGSPGPPGSPGPTAPPGSPSPGAGRGTTFGMAGDPGWVSLPGIGPPDGRPVATVAGGIPIVVCSVRGTLYAYYDACAACGSSLADGTLAGERLGCPACGAGYDVRSAGRSMDDSRRHLDPLPLLTDSQGVRVALPAGAEHGSGPAAEAVPR